VERDVLLVNANRLRPAVAPLGLEYAGELLGLQGFGVRLLDLCFEQEVEAATARALESCSPVLVGVTLRNTDDCYMASGEDFLPGHAEVVAAVRRHTEAPVVVGGSGYSVSPGPILGASGADYGIAGDGEMPLALAARALSGDGELRLVPGLVWREKGEVRQNAPWLGPVEALPGRGRRVLDNRRYFAEGGQAGIETKRGCDRACIYCADPLGKGRRVRTRTPSQVADEFEALLGQEIDHFHLCDSEFNVPTEHAFAVCEELSRRNLGERARWYTYATPAGFTVELARAMRGAGCVGIDFGADSGDDRTLAALGRDFNSSDLGETAEACRGAGLVFMYDLLLGGPEETRESAARTIELMKQISPDRVGVSLGVRVYPGTKLSGEIRREGPIAENPNLRGVVEGNADLLKPVYYCSSGLGEEPEEYVASLVGGDQRFFFPTSAAGTEAYNYSDNERLVDAIRRGYRGAYWDILRRLGEAA
jgi:radical SAM superfamily enzyme YgiQ (UPF0313 family)